MIVALSTTFLNIKLSKFDMNRHGFIELVLNISHSVYIVYDMSG